MAVTDSDHPFDAATRLNGEPGRFQGQTSEHYANMVGPFGGVIVAVLLKAALIHPERQGDPLSLTVNFVAPVADGSFTIEAIPMRTNRSTQHWNLTLLQDRHAAATATAVFASRKTTWSSGELPFPSAPSPDDVRPVTLEGFPAWVGHYDYRVIRGGIPPFITVEDEEPFVRSVTLQWVNDRPRRAMDVLSLAAICDSFFPRIYIRRNQFVPASTVSFTVYFHAGASEIDAVGDRPVLCNARANRFHDNYFDQTAEVWSPDGVLLATSSQVVYYKE